jgi:hypothetical protein
MCCPRILSILDNLRINVLNFIFITNICIAACETSTLTYLHPLTQPKVQSKLERSGKHKVKQTRKSYRRSLTIRKCFPRFDKPRSSRKKLLYCIRNPGRRYQPFFWHRCGGSNLAIMVMLLETLLISFIFVLLYLLLLVYFLLSIENPKNYLLVFIIHLIPKHIKSSTMAQKKLGDYA